ncbi:TIGR00282 family metallophosphoesterase [Vermiphilus pyriformis]|uniref:Metallophosphoesterase n=1 Tax=candidate division TM6 bacterium JCVI TM6SC1 TaxID=1306947 RepID=A0A0D2I1M7_9BACT|nr:metallophosphoesterase [candidate division TM6 bacterium JCVI TM6SC1]UNE35934.1 MAG: TIGR00282 family metallophosphoesterase [Vermiphilus pyriformis]
MRILFIGDVVGEYGRALFAKHINTIMEEHQIDGLVVNGENSSDYGKGTTSRTVQFFKQYGANVITSGNHIWDQKEIYNYISEHDDLLRPANFPAGTPGTGITFFQINEHVVCIINLQGRVFMRENLDCPFRSAQSLLSYARSRTPIIFVDFHAEATSEKEGLGYFLDGKISGLVGTHTHVQTADERILPGGTGYITDLGMAGALNSMLGMTKEPIIERFLTQMPHRFVVDTNPPGILNGVWIEVDTTTGKATDIQRVAVRDETRLIAEKKDR